MTAPPPPPPPDDVDPTLVEPPGRRVVVDEEVPPPPVVRPYPWWLWFLVALCLGAAIVFAVLWWTERDDSADVPTLVGLTQVEAQQRASDSGFALEVVRRTGDGQPNTVLDQAPQAGVSLEKGAQLMAVVSAGPGQVAVPLVVGLKEANAEELLSQAGLESKTQTVTSPKPEGTVVEQDPTDGTQVPRGSTVTLSASNGQGAVTVPAVQGMSQADAVDAVTRAGLVPVVIRVPSEEPVGTVTAQDPAANQKAQSGAKVRINVSGGPASTSTETETVTTSVTTELTTTRETTSTVITTP